MKIKVYDVDEKRLIGFRRAFLRESIGIAISIVGVIYLLIDNRNLSVPGSEKIQIYDNLVIYTSFGWFLLELVTTLSTTKRRAVNDFIARSVVIDLTAEAKATGQ